MTVYAVGDIQGCLEPLQKLLDKVSFEPGKDQLWAAGDIVNRGPQSLHTIRFLKSLGASFRMVLGNHDLHLLATARGFRKPTSKDTLGEIYVAGDADELLTWLQSQPLLIHDLGYVMVHAGIPPQWSLSTVKKKALVVEKALLGEGSDNFFAEMYGNTPAKWKENLLPAEQLRVITNYLTRMRFCDAAGNLELTCKAGPDQAPAGYKPWFSHRKRKTAGKKIIFGHWAALDGRPCGDNLFPLDTGCVWGKRLRLLNLDTGAYIHYRCGK
ncbi:MAG: diadenosine tetraphosphatase [Gammaproteobacteria bacterium]|nr:MAG: diadenosine tetraphosphatase [Gammaproteobacteria bacterium]RLA54569.1 MAG: diadenosine tetraphosphatase [Gammaproteobacteria bacterium]